MRPGSTPLLVGTADAGLRLDAFLARRLEGLGRARARRWIEQGAARIGGRRARKGDVLAEDDVVLVATSALAELGPARPDPSVSLSILHEDESLVVVDKPAGIPTQPLSGAELGTLVNGLLARYPGLPVGYGPLEPGVVHRLDVDTSGAVIVARTDLAFERLRALLRRGGIDKRYEVLCAGRVERGTVFDGRIDNDPGSARRSRVVEEGGKPARTVVVETEPLGDFTRCVVEASVAARHQVRVHFASAGHALAGDALYGGPSLPGLMRHYLHASTVGFRHPVGGGYVSVEAPRPTELSAVLFALR